MKVLIYGSKGWIGSQFINLIKNNDYNIIEGISRVDNYHDINNELDEIKPTHVISFIGRTHGVNYNTIDYLEQEGKLVENIRDNLFSPFVLAQLCNQKNIHYTYLGTGCIFKYDNNHPYEEEINGFNEEESPNFFGSSYSIVKGFTDMMMHMYPNVLNLRIRMPITNNINPRNFITKITSYKKICSIKNSMTVLPELLPYIVKMMEQNITGTINLTNTGLISHNEILEMYTG
jgi:dTDP-4-dehydrorhamnose reductase